MEPAWRQSKHAGLANYIPEDTSALAAYLDMSLAHTSTDTAVLRGLFDHAKRKL